MQFEGGKNSCEVKIGTEEDGKFSFRRVTENE
jgi:hypothetical protein